MINTINNIYSNYKLMAYLKNIAFILSFAFLTGISAGLKLEIGLVPITMQTLVVLLSGVFLGSRMGALSQLTYLLMGVSGIFWFSHGGGLAYLLSPTFGYIIGFILAAFTVGLILERFGKNIKTIISATIIGSAMVYIPGLLWLMQFVGLEKALMVGLYPFIIGDVLKVILVVSIISFLKK